MAEYLLINWDFVTRMPYEIATNWRTRWESSFIAKLQVAITYAARYHLQNVIRGLSYSRQRTRREIDLLS